MPAPTLPSASHAATDNGHTTDHNLIVGALTALVPASSAWLLAGVDDVVFTGSIVANSAGQTTSAAIAWIDGTAGVYTATCGTTYQTGDTVLSQTWTYVGSPTRTVTQPTMTYTTTGALSAQPARTVS